MTDNQILLLGMGLEALWKLVDLQLDTSKQPHELRNTFVLFAVPCARPTTSRRGSGGI